MMQKSFSIDALSPWASELWNHSGEPQALYGMFENMRMFTFKAKEDNWLAYLLHSREPSK